jgi:hypothetical protein
MSKSYSLPTEPEGVIPSLIERFIDSCVSNVLSSGWEDSDAAIRKPGGA